MCFIFIFDTSVCVSWEYFTRVSPGSLQSNYVSPYSTESVLAVGYCLSLGSHQKSQHLRESKVRWKRLRWSRGSVLAFATQVRRFKPGRCRRIFQGEKILSTPSFGGEVKPSVPCRRFTSCKRFLNATWKSGISGKIHRPFLVHIVPPLATRISGETTSDESWNV